MDALTPRWTPLFHHPQHYAMWNSPKRHVLGVAGRRSGKTEILGKRKRILRALSTDRPRHRCLFMAPTRDQAKGIYWEDLKDMVPSRLMANRPSETELTIRLINGAELIVVGMDKPHRVEGKPIDDGVMDEYADMKPDAWSKTVRPALDTLGRPGSMDFIGKPKGRGHFWDLVQHARNHPDEWDYFHWTSETILTPEMIRSARRTLDPKTYAREYLAEFLDFSGRAYYAFHRDRNTWPVVYRPELPLVICLDFNVSPGVAVMVQEQRIDAKDGLMDSANAHAVRTCCVDEIWIPDDSNTLLVCKEIWNRYKDHPGAVEVYGDATGGARKTSQTDGTDWDLVRKYLGNHQRFGDRLAICTPRANPLEKVRVNAVNSRACNVDEERRLFVNPKKCPKLVDDLEGVTIIEGTSGEINKKADKNLTHISDALGYYLNEAWPIDSETYTEAEIEY